MTSGVYNQKDIHRIHSALAFRTEALSLLPAHHLQQLVPYVALVLTGIDSRSCWRLRWRRPLRVLALVGGLVSRRRARHVGLVVHDASLGCTIAILGLLSLALRTCSARLLPGHFTQGCVLVIFLEMEHWGVRIGVRP